jgi:HupE / UreJ protein
MMTARYAAVRPLQAMLLAFGLVLSLMSLARAHEVLPAVADMELKGTDLTFRIELNAEAVVAGINLAGIDDTNEAPEAASYDALRALPPEAFVDRFAAFWPTMATKIKIAVDGQDLALTDMTFAVPPVGDVEVNRMSELRFKVVVPTGAQTVVFGWDAAFGTLVLRQQGVPRPYDGYVEAGANSEPIPLGGGGQVGPWQTFLDYTFVGFDHIVPKGLDHILFVLGLFFLSTRLSPILWQVSAFTLAHTVTLALGALGYVTIPASIVEPIIAASIVFIAVENLFASGLTRWRPYIVFGFGLLHGLGFASVLGEFGLPEDAFLPALIGFNVGVEVGQLMVILSAFVLVGFWFSAKSWYKPYVANMASAAIAAVGAYWFVERTFL